MQKKFLIAALALVTILLFSLTFTAQQTNAPAMAPSPLTHDRVESAKVKNMMNFFVNNANKRDHSFTKFNREELIAALTAMPDTDTVRFVIGAFIDDGVSGQKKGKPVILLQVTEEEKTVPGGGQTVVYKYLQGAICPPPNGACALEQ